MAEVGGAQSRIASVDRALARGAAAQPFAWIARNLEAEQERWFLWLPVMFGTGIALYFLLPVEPGLLAATLPAVAALVVHLTFGRSGLPALATAALLAAALGMAAGKLRTEATRAPVIERRMGPIDVYGFVELVEPRPSKGQRLTIRVAALEKHEPHAWPYRVRVRAMSETRALEPGDAVRLKATLSPPPGPALPGDYDFARAAWFQALSAVGYATAPPEIVAELSEPPLSLRASAAIARVRQAIGRRVVETLPGQTGAIANALITGQRV